jgi:hypothetical protein
MTLLCSSSRLWCLVELFVEGPVEVAGEVALDAAADFAVGLALGTAALGFDGGRDDQAPPLSHQHTADGALAIIPEPECPNGGSGFAGRYSSCWSSVGDLQQCSSARWTATMHPRYVPHQPGLLMAR